MTRTRGSRCSFCAVPATGYYPILKSDYPLAGRGSRAATICDECVEKAMLHILQRKHTTLIAGPLIQTREVT